MRKNYLISLLALSAMTVSASSMAKETINTFPTSSFFSALFLPSYPIRIFLRDHFIPYHTVQDYLRSPGSQLIISIR